MYEMEGPLPASLLRPTDHSASGRCTADHRLPKLPRNRRSPGGSEVRSFLRLSLVPWWRSNFYWLNRLRTRGSQQLLRRNFDH
jgi:hypothetical protein